MASTEDVQALDKKIQVLDNKVTAGFERIEYLLLEEQRRKIEELEQRMKRLEDALPVGSQASPSNPTQKAANDSSHPFSHPASLDRGGGLPSVLLPCGRSDA
jgi:hypothetical protein